MLTESDVTDITTLTHEVYSVSQLNHEVRALIESGFARVWVEAEISNFSAPTSGHLYFTLKDAQAQVRCAMFRGQNLRLGFRPANGMQVLVCAEVSLYEPRGDYQLIVTHMEPAGDGRLRLAFEQLKQKLQVEGLFDAARKKTLPTWPRRLGVITSPTGAAIRDVLTVLNRRYPNLPVLIYPVPVQGDAAAPQIAAAIDLACERNECDVLLVTRGGGSLEDLWAFNEEVVARALARCTLPVVSAIGHEVDFTIADFVADLRAPTPSAAAEILSPHRDQILQQNNNNEQRLIKSLRLRLGTLRDRITWLSNRLQRLHPGQRLRDQAQKVDDLEQRLVRAQRQLLSRALNQSHALTARLHRTTPQQRIADIHSRLEQWQQRLHQATRNRLEQKRARFELALRSLDALSPLATLARGFAIVQTPSGQIVRDVTQLQKGDLVTAQLQRGTLTCRVEKTET